MFRFRFIIPLFLLGCNEKVSLNLSSTADTTIQLIDSLGSISLQIPPQTDTFIKWIRQNDCGIYCEEGKYRFQDKKLPIFKESGFFWIGELEDSVNQLTISHHRSDTLVRNNDSFALNTYSLLKENLESDPRTINIISDTIQIIGDRYFCIFKIADWNIQKGVFIRRLVAFTSISGKILQFRYDLLTQRHDSTLDNFFNKALINLQTVRIKDGG